MSNTIINWSFDQNSIATDPSSVLLEDPQGGYGLIRKDTNGVVVPAGTPLVRLSKGVYEYSFVDPAPNLEYRYYIKTVVAGEVTFYERDYSRAGQVAAPLTGRYSSEECLYSKFGQDNILRWATRSDAETADEISARIQNAIDYADDFVDDSIRGGPYHLPFVDPDIPRTIKDLACTIAGIQLYEARGYEDFEEGGNRLTANKVEAYTQLASIRSGRGQLEGLVGEYKMAVIK